tara:strand:+ start:4861 stop:5331 length:471 start_codon:yes stop_codon:yes gene_type:complete
MALIEIPGRYSATAETISLGQSDNTGTRFIEILFKTSEPESEFISCRRYLTDKTVENLAKELNEAFGFNGNLGTLEEQLRGKTVSIVCEEEDDDQGNPRMRVKWINSPRKAPKPIENEEAFRTEMSGKFQAALKGATPPAPPPAPPADKEEDDVPF